MRSFLKMFFASFLAVIVAGVVGFGLLIALFAAIGSAFTDKESRKKTGNVLVIDLSKKIHELGAVNSLAMINDGTGNEAGLYDVMKSLSKAKKDDAIKGILLKLSPTPNAWATLEQLRLALKDFRGSGKFIYAYGEVIGQKDYYVASVSDSIYLNPAGDLELKGFATVIPFFKGMLEKLDINPEIYFAGKFKSATEPFRADKMSDANRLQIRTYQNGIWNEFLGAASEYMHADKASVHQLAETGAIQFPANALKHHMVASLSFWDEVEDRIKSKAGFKKTDDIKYISINDYAADHKATGKYSSAKIAVLVAEGNIVDGEETEEREIASKTFTAEVRKLARDTAVKAVVLRINSPGGSALASEVILRELELLKKKKHVVVSMGDYAASGGYYIASCADSIFALPNTLTGSIGVFGMLFNFDKLAKNKLGITFDEEKNAPYADFPSATRALTAEEGKRMQQSIDTIYNLFKGHVAAGRNLKPEYVDSIAQGRVWTGTDAKDRGLVDELGGLDRAVLSAAGMAHLKDYRVVTYPEPTDKLSALLRKFNMNSSSQAMLAEALKKDFGTELSWYTQVKQLGRMNGKALMMLPYIPEVN